MSNKNEQPKVYLAGPDVFYPCDLTTGKEKVELCAEFGLNAIYPSFQLPDDLFYGDYTKEQRRVIINKACKDGIRQSQIVILNLTPFRGFEMDSGTAFEAGFSDALGLKIFGYTDSPDTYLERMLKEPGTYQDNTGAWRDSNHHVIENFDLPENCMISSSCEKILMPSDNDLKMLKNDKLHMFKKAVEEAALYLQLSNTNQNQKKKSAILK